MFIKDLTTILNIKTSSIRVEITEIRNKRAIRVRFIYYGNKTLTKLAFIAAHLILIK